MRQNIPSDPAVLNSWKQIASYLDRGVRTVQRWERDLHLPVHRIGTGKRSPVYAEVGELRFWLRTSGHSSVHEAGHMESKPSAPGGEKPIESSRRLLLAVREMAHKLAETSARQHRQTEDLQARILKMRLRVR